MKLAAGRRIAFLRPKPPGRVRFVMERNNREQQEQRPLLHSSQASAASDDHHCTTTSVLPTPSPVPSNKNTWAFQPKLAVLNVHEESEGQGVATIMAGRSNGYWISALINLKGIDSKTKQEQKNSNSEEETLAFYQCLHPNSEQDGLSPYGP